MMDSQKLAAMLIEEEGLRLKVYMDTAGVPTIGVGRNLRDKGITKDEALKMLQDDIADVLVALPSLAGWYRLDHVRQLVLADMAFNLGVHGLLEFKDMLSAVWHGDWEAATQEMLTSRWAHQVGRRAHRLAEMMRTGVEQPL